MGDLASEIRNFLTRGGLSQSMLAQRAGVSQSAVSRAVSGSPMRYGRARQKLVEYMRQAQEPPELRPTRDAIAATWDGSEAHAKALARLILVSGELWPSLGRREPDDPR
jgi:predicted XRE-type DNA-binding protein